MRHGISREIRPGKSQKIKPGIRLSVISFTKNGAELSRRIAAILEQEKEREKEQAKGQDKNKEWEKEQAKGQDKNKEREKEKEEDKGWDKSKKREKEQNKDTERSSGSTPEVCLYTKCTARGKEDGGFPINQVQGSVGGWAGEQMRERNALLFIGACGIAVRAIAPWITDKLHDAPVLVMDEYGRHIIPILSGHVGGANELARYLAEKTGAEPVITTATDLGGKFAVDLFAERCGFYIVNKEGIAKVSSKVLAGQELTIAVEPGHEGSLADGMRMVPYPPREAVDIVVTSEDRDFDTGVLLKPKEYMIGMGCKKGKSTDEIDGFLTERMKALGISAWQICALASISQKKDEQGMTGWCRKQGIAFLTYTAEELQSVKGEFTGSAFVQAQVGVDNVCERAALKACETSSHQAGYPSGDCPETAAGTCGGGPGSGILVLPKYAEHGMTAAVAKREWRVYMNDK